MPIPDFQSIMLPLLKILSDEQEHSMRELIEALAQEFNLSEEERRERIQSGPYKFDNRCHWTRLYLLRAGLIESPRRGIVKITPRGLEVLEGNPERIDLKFLMRFPEFVEFRKGKSTDQSGNGKTPEEALEENYQELRNSLAQEILEKVKSCSPKFFENLVVELLVKMGYGGSIIDAGRSIGASGDEGLDGIIKEDKLGLDVVYIQAKRWQNQPVGRPEIQKFVGALEGKKAKKGVFITTSNFSQEAREYAAAVSSRVVLIDGEELAQLMIDNNVGVTPVKVFEIKKIDLDYFEES